MNVSHEESRSLGENHGSCLHKKTTVCRLCRSELLKIFLMDEQWRNSRPDLRRIRHVVAVVVFVKETADLFADSGQVLQLELGSTDVA